jgi:hypothetical protein
MWFDEIMAYERTVEQNESTINSINNTANFLVIRLAYDLDPDKIPDFVDHSGQSNNELRITAPDDLDAMQKLHEWVDTLGKDGKIKDIILE